MAFIARFSGVPGLDGHLFGARGVFLLVPGRVSEVFLVCLWGSRFPTFRAHKLIRQHEMEMIGVSQPAGSEDSPRIERFEAQRVLSCSVAPSQSFFALFFWWPLKIRSSQKRVPFFVQGH